MATAIAEALAILTGKAYHYHAPANAKPPYIVWAEDGENTLAADNRHAETATQGTIDLFTKTESDPLADQIGPALEEVGAAYYLASVQYEEETGLIHHEWVWEV